MSKETSENLGTFYQHYPCLATVVTARSGGKNNAMAVAWHMPVSKKPPLYAVAISTKRFTYGLILEAKEFAVNFLPADEAELVVSVGSSKGREIDKFRAFNILKDNPIKIAAPILKAAYAAFECRLLDDRPYGDHRLLVGEILAVHWQKEAFFEDGTLNLARVNPVLYLGNEQYLDISECSVRTLDRDFCASCLKD